MNRRIRIGIAAAALCACMLSAAARARAQDCVGWWTFDDSTRLTAAVPGFGGDLELAGTQQRVDGPAPGNGAVRIPVGSHYRMTHGIAPNGGGALVNEYTLRFDVRVESIGPWRCLFQTDTTNIGDGDCFISPAGTIGVSSSGYSTRMVRAGEWYRLVVSVDMGNFYRCYLDGTLVLEGLTQVVDGRFALEPALLLFADNDGEDGVIDVAEVMIWNRPLTAAEAAGLGGFEHAPDPRAVALLPYLQAPRPNSITISWHDSSTAVPVVEYGATAALGRRATGGGEDVDASRRWQTVRLEGLQPNTEYFYRCISGGDTTPVAAFRSAPDSTYRGHLRFLVFSDSQTDTARFGTIVRRAVAAVAARYGADLHNQLHLVAHTGDILGNGADLPSYLDEYFRPLAPLSASVPCMVAIGNHEGENPAYYQYMKYEDMSPRRAPDVLAEKFYAFTLADTRFFFLNPSLGTETGPLQTAWLDSSLALAEASAATDFAFVFLHYPARSEIWPEGNSAYVAGDVLGVLRRWSKVQMLSGGHTHAYERGVVSSLAGDGRGDFRTLICGGAAGGLDRWGMYTNQRDEPDTHVAFDHHGFVLIDIDVADRSYTGTFYSFGNDQAPLDCVPLDTWHRRLAQAPPEKPVCELTVNDEQGFTVLYLRTFRGADSAMSAQFQVTGVPGDYSRPLFDTTQHWQDVYGADVSYQPIDRNRGIALERMGIRFLELGRTYAWRGRYRDRNLRWGPWSDEYVFTPTGVYGAPRPGADFMLLSVAPNPTSGSAVISFHTDAPMRVEAAIHDALGRRVRALRSAEFAPGAHGIAWDGRDDAGRPVAAGLYRCRISSGTASRVAGILVRR